MGNTMQASSYAHTAARRSAAGRSQRGFTLMELIVFTAILAIIVATAMPLVQDLEASTQASIAADQLREVSQASTAYIKANYAALQGIATPTTAAAVSTQTLQTQRFLPANGSYQNPWRQTYRLYVLEPTAGSLLGLVLTEGGRGAPVSASLPEDVRFAERTVPAAARRTGAMGGFVSTGNVAGSVAGRLYGVGGGWTFDLAGTNVPNPGPGHLAAMLYLAEGELTEEFLYRSTVPGKPEANRMQVHLDMAGNDINNVDELRARAISVTDAEGLLINGRNVGRGLVGWAGLVRQLAPEVPLPGDAAVACPTPATLWSYAAIATNVMPSGLPQPIGGVRVRLEQSGSRYAVRIQLAVSSAWQDADTNAQAWVFVFCGNGA